MSRRSYRIAQWLLVAALVLLLAMAAWAQGVSVAQVQTVAGSVSLIRARANATPLTQGGVQLRVGDTVKTGPNGRARVVTNDGKRATLGPNSSVTIGQPGKPDAWQVSAGKAAIWITGKRRTEVSTPGAIAAAEGTGFEIEVAEDGTTTLTVAEGIVQYSNDKGSVAVNPNQQSVARPGQAPSRPAAVDASGVFLFEGTIESLTLPLEPPKFFNPAPGAAPAFGTVLTALEQKRPDLAEPALAGLSPNSAEGALASGLFLLAQGKAAEASPQLTRATELAPQSPAGPTYLGLAQFRQGKLKDAETTLRDAIRREPKAYAAHAYLSSVLLATGNTKDAETEARQAVALEGSSPLVHEALGTVYLFSGRAPEASKELRQALDRNPMSPSAHIQLAKALAAGDDLVRAMDEASQAVALDPADASARSTLGVLFMVNKDPHRAEREFRYALKLAPNLAAARTGLASVAAQKGRFAEALREQKAALDLDSGSAQAQNNLGAALTAKGQLHDAQKALNEAVKLQPTYATAHANLAIAYLEDNQYGQAVREGLKAVQLGDKSAFVHTTLARIYLRERRYDSALAELRRAEQVDPDYPLQHYYLGQVYLAQGRDRDSLRSIFRGLTLDPGTMVEQRQFARTEATLAGGENGTLEANAKTDGRALGGDFSYFVAGAHNQSDGPRRNDDLRTSLVEAIAGYQASPRSNYILYSSVIDDHGGRMGQVTGAGVETPFFRHDLSGTDIEFLSRQQLCGKSYLTARLGYERLSVGGFDPKETFTFLNFLNRSTQYGAEVRVDARLNKRDAVVSGVSYTSNQRDFNGTFALAPGPGLGTTHQSQDPGLILGYFEWQRQLNSRTDIHFGPYFATQSGQPSVVLPKFVGRTRLGDGSTFALLAYPTLQEDNASLRPVETWARPIRISQLGLDFAGWLESYEATWQKPWASSQLFTATAFYRRAHRLLMPIQDPNWAGLAGRGYFPRAEMEGGEIGYERWINSSLSARVFGRYQESNSLMGSELPYIPKWESGARLTYLNTHGIRAFAQVDYVGDREHIAFVGGPTKRIGSFVTADLRTEWQVDLKHMLFIEVRDLFDRGPTFYRNYPTYGRTILGGVEIRF